MRQITNIDYTELKDWRLKLEKKLDALSKHAKTPKGHKLVFLEILGSVEILTSDLQLDPTLKETIKTWSKITPKLKDNPLFPVERLSSRINVILEQPIESVDALLDLARKLEQNLANRSGDSVIAERCRDRALMFYKKGEILRAIDELHEAKVKWFNNESIRGSLLTIMMLGRWYNEIDLHYAAKYCFLAALRIASNDNTDKLKKYLPDIASALTSCEFAAGNWLNFLDRVELFLKIYQLFNNDPSENIFLNDSSVQVAGHLSILNVLVSRAKPTMTAEVAAKISKFGLDDFLSDLFETAKVSWKKISDQEIKKNSERDLSDVPFGDCGHLRQIRWNQFGLDFEFTFKNDWKHAVAVETLISAMQAMLCDFYKEDLKLVPGKVKVKINTTSSITTLDCEEDGSNESSSWTINVPATALESSEMNLAVIFQIISGQSLLSQKKLFDLLERRFKAGLKSKLFIVNSFENLAVNACEPKDYESAERTKFTPLFFPETFKAHENERLPWNDKLDPDYDRNEMLQAITRRYDRALVPSRQSLKRLSGNKKFQETIDRLRKEGWLDWQILNAFSSAVVNFRANPKNEPIHPAELKKRMMAYYGMEEDPKWETPPDSLFEYDHLSFMLKLSMGTTMNAMGLQIPTRAPKIEGLIKFMKHKFNFFVDDVPHSDPFKPNRISKKIEIQSEYVFLKKKNEY